MIETIEQKDVALITRPVHAVWAWNIAEKVDLDSKHSRSTASQFNFETKFPFFLYATLSD